MLDQLQIYYDTYEEKLLKLYEKLSPIAAILGSSNHPKDAPCNEEFYESVEKWIREFLAASPTQEEVEKVTGWILMLAKEHREQKTYWFCYALQGLTRDLIPLISQAKALELQKCFDEAYPKREWLPIQREIYKMLENRSGQAGPKRGLFRRS